MSVYSILFVIALTCGKGPALRSRRFIIDGPTGWSSWEQYAACSVSCLSFYDAETKQCCDTGNNRVCYNLPWDRIKQYVGTCENPTTTGAASSMGTTGLSTITPPKSTLTTIPPSSPEPISSTTPSTTSTTTTSTTSSTTWPTRTTRYTPAPVTISTTKVIVTTTPRPPLTLPPVPITCKVCAGPEFLCEKLYRDKQCEYPNNYCINRLTNHLDGSRSVVRSCGNFDTCYRDYYLGSSDNDKCRRFEENSVITLPFSCTFCCVADNCNLPILPAEDTLYSDL